MCHPQLMLKIKINILLMVEDVFSQSKRVMMFYTDKINNFNDFS